MMNNLPLQNICSNFNTVYYSLRKEDGSQEIIKTEGQFPYFYQLDNNGDYLSYKGEKLTKIHCKNMKEVRDLKNLNSFEADVNLNKRFLINNVDNILKSKTKIIFFDIEVECTELPRPKETKTAPFPISTIVTYNNYSEEYKIFFVGDFKSEYDMLDSFSCYIQKEVPDILTAWNVSFDHYYLFYRYPDYAKKISPLDNTRWKNEIDYPACVSVVDMLGLYHKFTLGKKDSYALDNVAHDELNFDLWGNDTDFSDINLSKEKCQKDVEKLVKLDEKLNLFEYFDEVRLLTKVEWEDLPAEFNNYQWYSNNSRAIDMLAFQEAKKLNVVLPSKNREDDIEKIDGAYRKLPQSGLFNDIGEFDLSGAYPQIIIDFCLSPENFVDKQEDNTIKIDIYSREDNSFVRTYYVKQNPKAILPSLMRRLLDLKNELKEELKKEDKNSLKYKILEVKYAARKALCNTGYGTALLPFFRLFSKPTGDCITFLVRDLLHFTEEQLKNQNKIIRYIDTDGLSVQGKEDLSVQLNKYAKVWAIDKYNNSKTNITFEYKGYYSSIFFAALCRYRGRLETSTGRKVETKGLQIARRDSGKWVQKFQEKLYDLILDNKSQNEIFNWIELQIEDMKVSNILEIAVPCKLTKPKEEYKKKEIHFEAVESTQKLLPDFKQDIGNRFYWIYTKKERVLALDSKKYDHIKRDDVDWNNVIERNIFNILVPIMKGLGWQREFLDLTEKYNIILGSQERNTLLEELPNYEELKSYYSAREVKKRKIDVK